MSEFETKLTALLNEQCKENESNTPDFILAKFLASCLNVFNNGINDRDIWYNISPSPGEKGERYKKIVDLTI